MLGLWPLEKDQYLAYGTGSAMAAHTDSTDENFLRLFVGRILYKNSPNVHPMEFRCWNSIGRTMSVQSAQSVPNKN